jgi:hypothetical protein
MTGSDDPMLSFALGILSDRGISLTPEEVQKVVAQYTSGLRALERVRVRLGDEDDPAGAVVPPIRAP